MVEDDVLRGHAKRLSRYANNERFGIAWEVLCNHCMTPLVQGVPADAFFVCVECGRFFRELPSGSRSMVTRVM
jgi:hypothetical protein